MAKLRFKTAGVGLATVLSLAPVHGSLAGDATTAPAEPSATAQAVPRGQPDPRAVYTLVTENDLYAFDNSDRHYSNGIRLSYLSADGDVPAWADALADAIPHFHNGAHRRIGWALGHTIYTPEDKTARELIPDDRPYAAWLYVGLALQSETEDVLDTVELDVGVVGPAALGKPVQNEWHRYVAGADPAYGWGNQLDNELGVNLVAERKWRHEALSFGDLGLDVVPHISGSLGNVFTYGGGGAMLRFGDDLSSDFGPPRIRPALPGSGTFKPRDKFGWYLFLGGEGRAVVQDISLDGNTWEDSHTQRKRQIVADLQAGLTLMFERFRVSYTHVMRTKEFYGQDRPDYFGSISVSARF